MAASISDTLAQLCTPDAKVRDTYFSETYRRKFKLNEQSGMWDITHIQIPFAPERERSLMQRFGIQSEEELIEFYRRLPLHIANERTMLQSIAKVESEKRVGDNFVSYILQKSRKLQDGPEWGREYFFVSEPMDAVISGKTSVTLLELVLLATRFTQSIKLLHETGLGIHIGAWDLDTIYVIQGEEGFNRIVNGSLLYGEMESQDSIPLLVSTPGTACADVWKGNRQSIDTDLFAIASILWAVSNGDHWTDEPDFAEAPRYAPDGLVETLVLCRDGGGETALKNVHTRLHELANEIKRRPEMNIEIPLGSKKLGVRPRFLIEANSYDLVKSESAGLGTEENHPGPQAEPAENTPDAEMPNPSDQGQAHEAELPENVVGGGEEKSEDPLVEGFEMVSANFDIMPCEDGTDAPPADRADTSETSDFEFLDIPFDIPPEPPQKKSRPAASQKAPLAPKANRRMRPMNESEEKKPFSKKKGVASAAAIALSLLIVYMVGLQVFSPASEGPAPALEATENGSVPNQWAVEDQEWPESATSSVEKITEEDTKAAEDEVKNAEEKAKAVEETSEATTESNKTSSAAGKKPTSSTSKKTSSSSSNSTGKKPSKPPAKKPPASSGAGNKKPAPPANNKPSKPANKPPKPSGGNNSGNNKPSNKPSNPGGGSGSGSSGGNTPTRPADVTFTVSPRSVSIATGGSVSLSANAPCSFVSSNSGVAYIAGRSIVGVASGTCVITATSSVDGSQRTIVVSVH